MPRGVERSPVDDLAPGDSLLVAGPPLTGKYRLLLRLLAELADETILVSTNTPASRVAGDYRTVAGDVPDERLAVIDCVSHDERINALPESERIRYVNSPRNLTQIGVAFTELLDLFDDTPGQVGVGLHSITALLMYADMQTVYKFVQVFTGQAGSTDAVCVAVFDSTVADDQQQAMIQGQFDAVVETRENDDGRRELRVRGIESERTDGWTRF